MQCSMAKYPCSAQLPSITAMPNHRVSRAVPNHQVSLQCPTTKYPCSAQPLSIPALLNCRVSLQCPTAEYPCSDQPQPQSVPTAPNSRVSLQCPTPQYPCGAHGNVSLQQQSFDDCCCCRQGCTRQRVMKRQPSARQDGTQTARNREKDNRFHAKVQSLHKQQDRRILEMGTLQEPEAPSPKP